MLLVKYSMEEVWHSPDTGGTPSIAQKAGKETPTAKSVDKTMLVRHVLADKVQCATRC